MKFKAIRWILLLFLLLTGPTVTAVDLKEGKSMYEKNCTKCHDSSVFTRKERNVNDLEALKKQVHACVSSQGFSWFDEDEENVIAYLNESYYKFK